MSFSFCCASIRREFRRAVASARRDSRSASSRPTSSRRWRCSASDEADVAEGVTAELGLGAGGFELAFAGGDRRAEFGDLGVLGRQRLLRAVAALERFGLGVVQFGELALFALDAVVGGGERLAGGTLVGLGDGKFLRGELRGVAGGRDVEFVGVHRGLDAEGLLVEGRELVVLGLERGADGADLAFAGEDARTGVGGGLAGLAGVDEAAAVDEVAVGGRDEEEFETGIGAPPGDEITEGRADVAAVEEVGDEAGVLGRLGLHGRGGRTEPAGSGGTGAGGGRGFDLEDRATELAFAHLGDDARQEFGGVEGDGLGGGAEDVLERGGGGDVDDGDEVGERGSLAGAQLFGELAAQHGLRGFGEAFEARLHLLEQAELGGELGDLTVLLGDRLLERAEIVEEVAAFLGRFLLGRARGLEFAMAGRDDGAGFGDALLEREAVLLGLSERVGKIDVTGLITAEVDFEVGDVAAGAGHLAFGDEDVLAGAAESVLGLDDLAGGFLDLGGLLAIGGVGGGDGTGGRRLGVGAAAEAELIFGDLELGFLCFAAGLGETRSEVVGTEVGSAGLVLGVLAGGAEVEERLLGELDLFGEFGAAGAGLEQRGLAVAEAVGEGRDVGAASGRVSLERRDLGATVTELLGMPGEVEVREAVAEATVAQRLGGLTAEGSDLTADFADHVGDAREVGVDAAELVERFATLGLVAGDAGGLFEEVAALGGIGGQDLVDLALHHERVGHAADTGVHEETLDVLQARRLAVDEVVAGALAVEAAHDGDFGEGGTQFLFAVGEDQFDLALGEGLAAVGAGEDDVLHRRGAQGLGGLFAQDPADRVDDVGLAAAIGSDHGRDPGTELDAGPVGEAFESVGDDFLEVHRGVNRTIALPYPRRKRLVPSGRPTYSRL